MRRGFIYAWITALLAGWAGMGRAGEPVHLQGSCLATFLAGAELSDDFTGKATSRTCRVTYRLDGTERVMDLEVGFNWEDVTTAHSRRNQKMLEHFTESGHHAILGTATNLPVRVVAAASEEAPLDLTLQIVMGGVTNRVQGALTRVSKVPGSPVVLEVKTDLSHRAFGYRPITLLHMLSVNEEVAVKAIFTLPPDPGETPPTPAP